METPSEIDVAGATGDACRDHSRQASRKIAQVDEFEVNPANFTPPVPKSTEEILAALDASVEAAQEYLGGVSESARWERGAPR